MFVLAGGLLLSQGVYFALGAGFAAAFASWGVQGPTPSTKGGMPSLNGVEAAFGSSQV